MIERLVVTGRARGRSGAEDLPPEIRERRGVGCGRGGSGGARSPTISTSAWSRSSESFWTSVYPLYMQREITRGNVRELVRKGLEEARGNYKIVARLFNMEPRDYKRFLNFLRKHDCQLPFKEYR